ncbi:hypothetical protein [Achromobacter aegrifaciens]|uniref:hypothetical protein n=1 Tax=Achromobacter aegrifaciens TaxID=1287736 RepID=UPI0014683473|nr:hypothetical protein [Achromobacter aegrifaciens]CAB3627136.1 hypothetical protein LMG26852_00516 [Achromobacter aegrifaciens]
MSTNDRAQRWAAHIKVEDEKYLSELKLFDPHGDGVTVTCPDCKANAWIRLAEKRYSTNPIFICCPAACGAYYEISSFKPNPNPRSNLSHFDIQRECPRDGAKFAVNGVIFRCPVCAIENPREVMHTLSEQIKENCTANTPRENLINYLSLLISTFDGVMRRANAIAVRNHHVTGSQAHPKISSFQNISSARTKLLPYIDMASTVNDWPLFLKAFQKRHLFAHSLGVVDSDYLDKTGDISATLGKQVPLSSTELVQVAHDMEVFVKRYFGLFLS